MHILDTLKEKNLLTQEVADAVLAESGGNSAKLESALMKNGIDPDVLLAALGEYYRLPTRRLQPQEKIAPAILRYLPEESARHYRLVPLEEKDGVLEVGVTDPDNLTALDALNFISSKNALPYKLMLILEQDLEKVLEMYANITGEVDEALTDLETELTSESEERTREKEEEKTPGNAK